MIANLKGMGDPANLAGMARFGITTEHALGVSVTDLRRLARTLGRDHDLAASLWSSGIHEARILASIVDDPVQVTPGQMEDWVSAFDSWDLCDQVCMNLFDRTPFAFAKALEWSERDEEFTKRAGFALMASAAVHRKDVPDRELEPFLPAIRSQATDDRTYVKKAVNWALRQIGKRSPGLHRKAITTARAIGRIDAPSARWISRDALRELESSAVRDRLARKS